ncbi:MAG: hypothetical protein HY652_07335 [Acidobacteria bacterium]|nr:hypothetical protein [Acidobacteriota bacterium]
MIQPAIESETSSDFPSDCPEPGHREVVQRILFTLDSVSAVEREVFVSCRYRGLSTQAAARRFNLTEDEVLEILHRVEQQIYASLRHLRRTH